MRRLSTLVAVLVVSALAAPAAALAADCPGADVRPSSDNLAQAAQTTLCLLNAERAGKGLGVVTEQAELTKASSDYSALMVSEQFFAHVSPDGSELSDRLTDAGYLGDPGSWMIGENIAWGESYLATPGEIVKAWMNSPPHRANILNGDYEEIGLGIALGTPTSGNAGATYTTDFGRRRLDRGPVEQAQSDITVGAGPSAPKRSAGASHGTSRRGGQAAPRKTRNATLRAVRRSGCRRSAHRSRSKRGTLVRARCAGTWAGVQKHL